MIRIRAARSALLGVLALSLVAPGAQAGGGPLSTAPLAHGVVHEVWPVSGSTARIHLARVSAGAPARLAVVQARGGLTGGLETPSSMCRRTRGCRVAVNGDFFTSQGPRGGVVAAGRMLRSPRPDHEQLSLQPLRATTSGLGRQGWAGHVQPAQGDPLRLQGVNAALGRGHLVLYTSAYGGPTPACTCVELVLAEGERRADQLGEPADLTMTGRGGGRTPLPPGTAVLAGDGAAGQRLTALADASHDSPEARRLTVSLSVAEPTRHNVGAHPVLLRDGHRVRLDDDPMLGERHPRTAVAWDGSGNVWLAAVDGRQPQGPGQTAPEVVTFLQRLGATDGVLLDGGGSTTLATPDGPLNAPSDGRERPVSNAVVLVMDPIGAAVRLAPPPPPAAPVASAPAPAPVAAPEPPAPAPPAPKPVVAAPPPAATPVAPPVVVPEPAPVQVFSRAGAEREATVAFAAPQLLVRAEPVVPIGHVGAVAAALALLAAAAWAQVVLPTRRARHRRR